ncbi:MAG: 2-oxoacid:acceptor oxidoreductase family protein [Gordonibacter sp.]|uniref:2-oxoacid:acceptor oxidoreductase family protein n=1 Tax=Gordonibacter sp. TaxID=1968902 RepID=UPI002FC5FEF3
MIEVLWHGRGGQGAFTAARLLGAAASMGQGQCALAFPAFGPERRGAPMRAYTKIDVAVIGDRSAIKQADYVIYLDDTLLGEGWDAELKPGGMVLANSKQAFSDERIVALDADSISAAVLGRPIPNTVFLGALSVLSDQVGIEEVEEAIRQYMPEKLHAKNIAIVDAAREATRAVSSCAEGLAMGGAVGSSCGEASPAADGGVSSSVAAPANATPGSSVADGALPTDVGEPCVSALLSAASSRPHAHIPTLRTVNLDPTDFAHTTCYEAGHLVTKNAGWRNLRPVIDAASCTGCLQCYMHCPDGTVYKVDGPAPVAIDLDFCKGCGICARACSFGSITMILESEAKAR